MEDIVGAVFARAGSKGLPGKNLKQVGGETLLARAIRMGLEIETLRSVYCSTDSEEIARAGREAGALVPFIRPENLATDRTPEIEAWRHLLSFLERVEGTRPDILVSLPPTAPLRERTDVEKAISLFLEGGADLVIGITPSQRSPWFNMVTSNGSGELSIVGDQLKPAITRRQDGPKVWDITTVVYVASVEYVLTVENLMDGKVKGVEVGPRSAIDIDTELDLIVADFLAQSGLGVG